VGLSCAWYLQEHGVEVTVLDESGVAAGASWGNGGYLTPALAVPLPEPALLREGLRGLLRTDAPVSIGRQLSLSTLAFLARFTSRATTQRWRRGMAALTPLCLDALAAFDELERGGVEATTHQGPITFGFETERELESLEHELRGVRQAGQEVSLSRLPSRVAPMSDRLAFAARMSGQRYLDPGVYAHQLACSVLRRGGRLEVGRRARARSVDVESGGVRVETWMDRTYTADAVVLATGVALPALARRYGVRMPMQAGRGYSFSVSTTEPLQGPLYLQGVRGALTPLDNGRVRVAGSMEIAGHDAPPDPTRIDAIVRTLRPYVDGVDWDDIQDRWVGSRPLTTDGLPLIGRTRASGVYVAGGHGMWGLTLGPVTGKLLASQVVTGDTPEALQPFNPLRAG